MREWFCAFDDRIIGFFTRITNKFQRVTNRTNYSLAQTCFVLIVISSLVQVGNYWIPVLGYSSDVLSFFVNGFFGLWFIRLTYFCTKAEERVLLGKELGQAEGNAFMIFDAPMVRLFLLCVGCVGTFLFILNELIGKVDGLFLFRVIDYLFFPAVSSFAYFLAVSSLPPGKSTVQE
ncbi:MAG: hypothetical protein AAB362_02785 [Patescibacteria group bacterium]